VKGRKGERDRGRKGEQDKWIRKKEREKKRNG
jgi:hypothetical protein